MRINKDSLLEDECLEVIFHAYTVITIGIANTKSMAIENAPDWVFRLNKNGLEKGKRIDFFLMCTMQEDPSAFIRYFGHEEKRMIMKNIKIMIVLSACYTLSCIDVFMAAIEAFSF